MMTSLSFQLCLGHQSGVFKIQDEAFSVECARANVNESLIVYQADLRVAKD
jgi:hypothetical protein